MNNKFGKVIFIFLLLLTCYLIFTKLVNFKKQDFPVIAKKDSLSDVVNKALEGTNGKYSIAIKNLKTGESYFLNEHQPFDSGSLYKIWIMSTAFKQIEEGKLEKDETLEEDVEDLNREFGISDEESELSEGKINFTVASALEQMITISHNYAALMLSEKVKLSNVRVFLTSNGFNESNLSTENDTPKITAYDAMLFFEKLYKGELANKENTQAMLDLLKRQQLNEKIPKLLPSGTLVAHKTGEINMMTHDAGIVFMPNGDYIISILSESNYPPGAVERIAQISKSVYDYFLKEGGG